MWIIFLFLLLCESTFPAIGVDEDCNEPLILPGNVNLTSTSTRNPSSSYGSHQATLHNTHAWCANVANADQYLIVDLGLVKIIKSIAIQGNPEDDEFLKSFSISYGVLTSQWITYLETGTKRVFSGASDTGSVFSYTLKNIITARYFRIKPETWYGHVCVRLQLFGCNADPYRALGMASGDIPDSAIRASSSWSDLPPIRARLYSTKYGQGSCWSSGAVNTNQWLQIDVGKMLFVTAIETQGRHAHFQWVTSYWFSFSNDGTTFTEYKDQNQARKTFQANSDSDTVVRHLLSPVIYSRFVRFNPITWKDHISMRVEVYSYGRDIPADLGITTNEIPDSQITASSALTNHDSFQGRLNYHRLEYAWCASVINTNQWLQFNFGHTMLVTGIVTQSRGHSTYAGQMIRAYKVLYSLDNIAWVYYNDDPQGSQGKIFTGNTVSIAYVTNMFNREIKARLIRINPTSWNGHISLRATVIGRRNGPLGSPVFPAQQKPSYITVYKNHAVKLECEAAVGDTPITVTWTHNGQVLQSKTSDTDLTLTGVTRAQEGFYNCTASNTLGKTSKMIYLHVQEPFAMCSKYRTLSDSSRLVTSSASYINDDTKLNETDWYVFKDNYHNYLRIPTTCVPENRCGATAPGYMQGALPTVSEGVVKRKVCFHSNGTCCHYSVDIYVRNCYMFYVYNLKILDVSWKGRYCGQADVNENPSKIFYSSEKSLALCNLATHRIYDVDSYFACMSYCNLDDECKSFNYNQALMTCQLNNSTANLVPQYLSAKPNYRYFGPM